MIYVFDLDGTLCDTKKNEEGYWDYMGAEPYRNRIEMVNNLHDEGHTVIIDTARGCSSGTDHWHDKTYHQLQGWGVRFDKLRVGVKLCADYFIDDKGVNSEQWFKDVRSL
jgi:FMN phosphatase YigB (HAD superfamily)